MSKITVIGAGSVGAAVANDLMVQGIASEILLVDVNKKKAKGEALDIYQGAPFHSPAVVRSGDYPDAAGSDIVVITCGKEGGILFDGERVLRYPAFPVDAVDTNGSGDVFHGAFAFGVSQGYDYCRCCVFASAVAALKCTKVGARNGTPTFAETMAFLKSRGVELM